MSDYYEYYNEAMREVRRLRAVVREQAEQLNVFNSFVTSQCEIEGTVETIELLKAHGATKELLVNSLNFDADEVSYIFNNDIEENEMGR